MQFQYTPYIWLLTASAVISLSLGIYTLLRQRKTKGSLSFFLCMLAATIWSSANALEMAASDLATKLFWANLQYIAYCFSPLFILALSMQFTGYDKWVRSKKILWLTVLPTIIVILVWTDCWHGLVRQDIHLDYSGSFPVIAKTYGVAFYIHIGYTYLLNFTSNILLIRAAFFRNTVYTKQAVLLLIGLNLLLLPNILYIFGVSPIERFDITPVFFAPVGLIFAWGIFRYRLFDLVPMARTTVLETMEAGVLVLDLQDRILDTNPAFERIVGFSASKIAAKTIKEVCGAIPELERACTDRNIQHSEFTINLGGISKVYEVLLSPLRNEKSILIGRLAVIYDITKKKQAEQEYLNQQWKLAVIEERERLARDMHDNLGQILGFINLQAQGIRQELLKAGVDVAASKIDKLVDVTQSVHQEIRDYICSVRNSESMEKNFNTALTKVITNFEEQTGLKVEFNIPKSFTGEELEPNVRINLLNMIKEALNNIRKHAKAEHVKIRFLHTKKEELCVIVEDDGSGFHNVKHNRTKTKFGLDIMQERALEIGARVKIKSVAGEGTRVDFSVPMKEAEKNEVKNDVG